MHVHIYLYVCEHVCVCVCSYILYIDIHLYIYILIYIYIHTHTEHIFRVQMLDILKVFHTCYFLKRNMEPLIFIFRMQRSCLQPIIEKQVNYQIKIVHMLRLPPGTCIMIQSFPTKNDQNLQIMIKLT